MQQKVAFSRLIEDRLPTIPTTIMRNKPSTPYHQHKIEILSWSFQPNKLRLS